MDAAVLHVAAISVVNCPLAYPAEREVAAECTANDGKKQPHVERHGDQHEKVAHRQLDKIHERLYDVALAERRLAERLYWRIAAGRALGDFASHLLQDVLFTQKSESFVEEGRDEDPDAGYHKAEERVGVPAVPEDFLAACEMELER